MSTGAVIKYRTRTYSSAIEEVEIVRETESSVFIARNSGPERRNAKVTTYDRYHDTWADAHAYLMVRAEFAVKHARQQLESANGNLGNIKGMKPPAGGAK